MYCIYKKKYQIPDLIHDHVDLDVHLDTQDGQDSPYTTDFGLPLKN